jgi:hypothetical protein
MQVTKCRFAGAAQMARPDRVSRARRSHVERKAWARLLSLPSIAQREWCARCACCAVARGNACASRSPPPCRSCATGA